MVQNASSKYVFPGLQSAHYGIVVHRTLARILLNTFGSLGDLHPFLAIALELRKRGHQALLATAELYRDKIAAAGLGFVPVRPDLGPLLRDAALIERVWDNRRGTEYLLRDVIFPSVEKSFDDLAGAAESADLLVTHSAGYAGPIAAERFGKPWLSAVLQPMVFFSAYDPPILAPVPWLRRLYPLGRWPFRLALRAAKWRVGTWSEPIYQLRRRLGLRTVSHPVFEGQFSPHGTLALFSRHFASVQPDWPPHVSLTGFVFYDQLGTGLSRGDGSSAESTPQELEEFLAAGPPPVVFTLGSSAVLHPGDFFHESVAAAKHLGCRAVLLTGRLSRGQLPCDLPSSVFVADYAPYSTLLPRASVTVHQGGIGTTAQALRAGRPMLVVPWAHDQPDNAERVRQLGVAKTLPRSRYRGRLAARAIAELLERPAYTEAAALFRQRLLSEDGARAACDRIEAVLKR